MYTENNLYFPHHLIPTLRDQRGPKWQSLVTHVMSLPECHEETLAFMLLMSELNGCVPCETDSYRAMKGCGSCVFQTLRRYKATDDELLAAFDKMLHRVRRFAQSQHRLSHTVELSYASFANSA